MLSHELRQVWITSDGKTFLDKEKAETHEKIYQKHKEEQDKLKDLFYEDF